MNIIKINNVLGLIIIVNILLFLFLRALIQLEYINPNQIETLNFFISSTNFNIIIKYPWTLITQLFTHINPGHIISNIIVLYIYGIIFLKYFRHNQLFYLYVIGGLFAFICLIIFNNIITQYDNYQYMIKSWNYGASGAVYAIMFAITSFNPNYSFKIFNINFLVKIKYITIIIVILPIIFDFKNLHSHVTHLGGGFYGLLYIYLYKKKSKNMFNKIINIFKSHFLSKKKKNKSIESDYEYNARKKSDEKKINIILEKISKSGYSSLYKKEKDTLSNYK